MSRLFTVSSIAIALLITSCASKTEVTDLDARLKALEEKVTKLETSKPAPLAAASAKPELSPEEKAKEDAALNLMKEAQAAIRANDFATAKTKLAQIQAEYADTRAGKAAQRMSEEVNLLGTPAPALEVDKWFQGKASFDKPTLVVFWEVWCPHCKREMPELAQLEPKFKGKVQFVGLTKMTKKITEDQVQAFIKDNSIGFAMGLEKDGSMSKAFKVTGIPAAALVKGGNVVWRGNPATLDEKTLTDLLAAG